MLDTNRLFVIWTGTGTETVHAHSLVGFSRRSAARAPLAGQRLLEIPYLPYYGDRRHAKSLCLSRNDVYTEGR
jgi:hypothetical protein